MRFPLTRLTAREGAFGAREAYGPQCELTGQVQFLGPRAVL